MCLALLSLTQNSREGLTFIQGRWQDTRSHSPLARPPGGTPVISGGTRGGSVTLWHYHHYYGSRTEEVKRSKLLPRVSIGNAAVTIFWPCVPEERRDENCSGQQNFRDHSGSGSVSDHIGTIQFTLLYRCGGDSMFTMFTPYDHIWCYNIRTYRGWIEKRSNCRALL